MPADRIGSAYSEHPLSRRLLRSCAASPRPMLAAPSGRCRHPLDPNTNSWQTHEDTLSSSAAQNLPLRVVSARGGIACRRTPRRLRISRNADSRRPQKRSGQRKNGAYRQAGKRGLYTSRKIVHTDYPLTCFSLENDPPTGYNVDGQYVGAEIANGCESPNTCLGKLSLSTQLRDINSEKRRRLNG